MECLHENLKFISEMDGQGRSNVTVCSECDEMLAATDITNGNV